MLSLLVALFMTQAVDTVRVADHGIIPDTGMDCTAPLRELLESCKGDGRKVVSFEPGRYDFMTDDAVRREIFISNTSSEEECPSKEKTIGILIEGQDNLTIDGHGATFVFHGKQTMIAIIGSKDVTLKNIHVDCERPGGSELTYAGFNPPYVDVRFHKDSWYSIGDDGILDLVGEGWKTEYPHCIELDASNGHFTYSEDWDVLHSSKAVELEPGLVRFETPDGFTPTVGNTLTIRDRIRDQVGILNLENKGVTFEDCQIHYMHGLGIISQFSEDVTMRRVYCTPREGSGRVLASSADFMHFSGCRGKIKVLDCKFCGAQDDPINVHGTNLRVVAADPASKTLKLRFMHGQSYGFTAFHPGDKVALVNAESLQRYCYAHVKNVQRINDYELSVTLDKALPEELKIDSDVVENITWTPKVEIRGNHFTRTSTRGVLMTSPRKAIISDNTFLKTGMAGILIAADARDWYESGPVRDVRIERNHFIDCCYNSHQAVITIEPSNIVDGPVHGKIRVSDNVFEGEMLGRPADREPSDAIICAKSTALLTVSGNIVNGGEEAIVRSVGGTKVSTNDRQVKVLGAPEPVEMSGNPLFEGWYADPEGAVFEGEYWIYPTYSKPYREQLHLDAFSSPDLVHWTKHENIITDKQISWLYQALWAPSVIKANGKYYLFFGGNDVHEGEIGGIGVATSDSPAGPFEDALGKPLIGNIVNGAQPIDQQVFYDEASGEYYLYYGGWRHCNVAHLSKDLLSLVPFDDGEMFKEITPENYVEGPFMLKRDGRYYFMWSEGVWTRDSYCVAYAVADNPFGPFNRVGKILQSDPEVATGAGHHSVIPGPGKDEWYIVYHRHPLPEIGEDGKPMKVDGNNRVVCIDKLEFGEDGLIKPVKITFEGVAAREL